MIALAPELERLHHLVLGEVEIDQVRLTHQSPDAMSSSGVAKAAMTPMMTVASSRLVRSSKLSNFNLLSLLIILERDQIFKASHPLDKLVRINKDNHSL